MNDDKLHICLVSALAPDMNSKGGIEAWARRVVDSKYFESNGIVISVVNTCVSIDREKTGTMRFGDEIKRTLRIVRDLWRTRKEAINLYCINSNCSNLGLLRDWLCSKIVRFMHRQYVTIYHCDISSYEYSRLSYRCLRNFAKYARKNYTLNPNSSNYLMSHFNLDSKFMPLFISNEDISIINGIEDIPRKPSTVLFVGRVSKAKGCDFLIDLAREMNDVEFVLVGVPSDGLDANLPDNIVMRGPLQKKEVYREMKASTVFAFPSRSEGFPNVVLEAMMSKLPIVASPCGATPLMIAKDGGAIIDSYDKQVWKNEIYKIIGDTNLQNTMGMANYIKFMNDYCEEKVVSLMCDYFREAIND